MALAWYGTTENTTDNQSKMTELYVHYVSVLCYAQSNGKTLRLDIYWVGYESHSVVIATYVFSEHILSDN
jgi:hypothetical protein